MNEPAHPPPLPPKSYRPWILLGVILLVITVPLLILLSRVVSYRSGNAEAVAALEAKIRASHEPLTLVELAATYPPIPEGENGAEVLLQLWEKEDGPHWHAFRTGETSLPTRARVHHDPALPILGSGAKRVDRVTDLKPESILAGNTYLEAQKEHLAIARTALGYSRFRFPIQITNGFSAVIPHLSAIKGEVMNFRIEGLLAAERGDVDGAIGSLEDAAKMGKTLASEPLLISQLVRIAAYNGVLDDLQRLMSRQTLSTNQLDRVDALLDQLQMSGAFRMTLLAERVCDLSAFDLPPGTISQLAGPDNVEGNPERGIELGMNVLSATGIKEADRRMILETLTEAIALAEHDDAESLEQHEQLFEEVVAKARGFPPRLFSAMLLPALQNVGARFGRLEARRRAAKLAIAVERYRMSHNGNLPDPLDRLVPDFIAAIPKDPFDGNPLRLEPLTKGFVVYSIGGNRIDDGGKEKPATGPTTSSDETFIIER